ncbi:hypothetical protein [Streptococcus suis]|nr:hypothetical protein [Streptococcus suis]
MKKTGKVLLALVLVPLVLPLGFIAVMLNPFLEIIYEEDKHGNSK